MISDDVSIIIAAKHRRTGRKMFLPLAKFIPTLVTNARPAHAPCAGRQPPSRGSAIKTNMAPPSRGTTGTSCSGGNGRRRLPPAASRAAAQRAAPGWLPRTRLKPTDGPEHQMCFQRSAPAESQVQASQRGCGGNSCRDTDKNDFRNKHHPSKG